MANILTFDNTVTVTVNGNSVSSGYILKNGDIIVATSATGITSGSPNSFVINSSIYTPGNTIDIFDNNISVSWFSGGGGAD